MVGGEGGSDNDGGSQVSAHTPPYARSVRCGRPPPPLSPFPQARRRGRRGEAAVTIQGRSPTGSRARRGRGVWVMWVGEQKQKRLHEAPPRRTLLTPTVPAPCLPRRQWVRPVPPPASVDSFL